MPLPLNMPGISIEYQVFSNQPTTRITLPTPEPINGIGYYVTSWFYEYISAVTQMKL